MGDRLICAMPPKKTKEAIAKAATAGGSKNKKKKWSKAKAKEKLQNLVLMDQDVYKKLVAEIPKQRVISVSNVSEKFKLNGALARRVILEFHQKGLIRRVAQHHTQMIYTRAATNKDQEEKDAKDQEAARAAKEARAEAAKEAKEAAKLAAKEAKGK
eukprot:c5524_g1_i1.p1 GENE.c5524_g1_i1~~c5524_g1_i1.p1  ORF type:complete len:157 (-),score=47.18 c5524_g1_i1:65-535(-)